MNEAIEKLSTPDPVDWIEKEFYIPETKHDPVLRGHFAFAPHQKDIIREIFARDENGRFRYSTVIWSDIKKSWKSSIAAAINLFRAHHTEWGEFYIIANDLKQANSRVSEYIRRAVELNPKLRKQYHIQGYRITAPSGSFIEAVPIDPSGEAGSNADQVTFSELWGAHEDAKNRMWSEMTIPPSKYGKAFRWIESYAGYMEESELLYSLYELGKKQGELLWPDRLYPTTDGPDQPLELYVNRAAGILCYWGTVPRLPDQNAAYYASESALLLPNEFQRIHRNQWVSSTETFVPIEWFDACKRTEEEWPTLDKKHESFIVTLDAAVSGASFGMYMGCRHPQHPDEVVTVYSRKWDAPKDGNGKIDYIGTPENPGPELELRRLISEYNVIEVAYDEFQLHYLCSKLYAEGLAWFRSFPQTGERLIADSDFRAIIRDRKLWHRGENELRGHIQNADAQIDGESRKIRIVMRSENTYVDLAVCASMCARELIRLNL